MNYLIFKKQLRSLQQFLNTKKLNDQDNYAKIISLSFLLYKMDTVLTNPKNLTPIKDMVNILQDTKKIFTSLVELKSYQKQTSQRTKRLNFGKTHKKLWQELWPEYKIKNDFIKLVNFRGKRLDFNNIRKEFKNKSILDVEKKFQVFSVDVNRTDVLFFEGKLMHKTDEQLNHMPRVAIGIRYTSAFL